jgi:hypothetical protein
VTAMRGLGLKEVKCPECKAGMVRFHYLFYRHESANGVGIGGTYRGIRHVDPYCVYASCHGQSPRVRL